jgi:sulfite reductase (NADPH) flavoprotein alpha-component
MREKGLEMSGENKLMVLYGTETGNSELLSMDICKAAEDAGIEAEAFGMDEIESDDMLSCSRLLIVCSTWGDGEQPDNAMDLFEYTEELGEDALTNMSFSVLALGDTAFDLFCEAGKEWDRVLEEKGATRIAERMDCDVDYEDDAEEWIEEVIGVLQGM